MNENASVRSGAFAKSPNDVLVLLTLAIGFAMVAHEVEAVFYIYPSTTASPPPTHDQGVAP